MKIALRTAALSLALPSMMAVSMPAAAATWHAPSADQSMVYRDHDHRGDRYYSGNYGRSAYAEPVYSNTPVWRGNDGRYYCKKKNGTTGLIIGGAAGALIGRSIAGRGDNTLGTILGAAGGALLGREVARNSGSRRCR
jgi:hypothetical protein